MAEERVDDLPDMLARWGNKLAGRKLVIAVAGKSGNGKSTLCNNLLLLEGESAAKTEDSLVSVTHTVSLYKTRNQPNLPLIMVDIPGLDGIDQNGAEVVAKVKEATGGNVDLLLYCVGIQTGTRINAGDRFIIQQLTTAFGRKVWEHTVLVFTFANKVAAEKLDRKMTDGEKTFKDLLRIELKKFGFDDKIDEMVTNIVSAPACLDPSGELNGIQWRESLLLECLNHCDLNAVPAVASLGWGDAAKAAAKSVFSVEAIGGGGVGGGVVGHYGGAVAGLVVGTATLSTVSAVKLCKSPFFPVMKSSLAVRYEQWKLKGWTPGGNLSDEEKTEHADSWGCTVS